MSAIASRRTIRTRIPARLDRLPWSRFHWRVVIGLGTVWILDGLEVTIVGAIAARLTERGSGIQMNAADIGTAAAIYVAGACVGALLFGQLTDRYGRKRLFQVTLSLYLVATVATAFAFAPWYFFVCRFFTGMGIGGEYSAINSAIDELIPARNRGQVDLAINGSYWIGSALGGLAALILLNTSLLPRDVGWRLAFGVGAITGLGILAVRRGLPESPRWLFIHGREEEAERIVNQIEEEVRRETGVELPEPDEAIVIRQRDAISFRELARVVIKRYPRRAVLGLALFIGQAFLYNAVTFDLGTILHEFFKVGSASVPYFMTLFALSNFLGPLLLGRYFDTVGRVPMISATYLLSATIVALLAVLLVSGSLTTWSFMAFVLATFFLASAGASSAYLTVSEVFPIETRALAIALFFAVGTACGGIVGPALFGQLIHSGHADLVAIGFFIGAAAMALGGIAELRFGVRAEGQSLENIATPLTAEEAEAEALLPIPVDSRRPADLEAYHERHEAVRLREEAEHERANAAEHRAALQESQREAELGVAAAQERLRAEQVLAQIAELRAQSREQLAIVHDELARAASARYEGDARVARARARAAQERARSYEERAAALAAASAAEAEMHEAIADAAAERALELERRALAEQASSEAGRLGGVAADLARMRAEMHDRWADVHATRAQALEARSRGDQETAARLEREARDRELIASAAEQRIQAAEHRARAEELLAKEAVLSQSEREQRIRQRSERQRAREGTGPRRLRPGPGGSFYSPGMVGTAGTASRLAGKAARELDREIEAIERALQDHGPTPRDALERLVDGRLWGPRRFPRALREALDEGRAVRGSGTEYGPGERPSTGAPEGTSGGAPESPSDGAPDRQSNGAPDSAPDRAPDSAPNGAPDSAPDGAPPRRVTRESG